MFVNISVKLVPHTHTHIHTHTHTHTHSLTHTELVTYPGYNNLSADE